MYLKLPVAISNTQHRPVGPISFIDNTQGFSASGIIFTNNFGAGWWITFLVGGNGFGGNPSRFSFIARVPKNN